MTLTWILAFMFVRLFSESTCTQDEPVCGDLSLQYVFSLVPSSTELPYLIKFLNTIPSAAVFQSSEDEGLVEVHCDPKDSEEVYRFTLDQDIYLSHSAYCVEKNEFAPLGQLSLGRNKLWKITTHGGLRSLIDRKAATDGLQDIREKSLLDEWTSEMKRILKNGRVLKARDVRSKVNKKEVGGKPENTESSINKNKLTMIESHKDVSAKMKLPHKERIVDGKKSASHKPLSTKDLSSVKSSRKTTSNSPDKRGDLITVKKTITRRSDRSETKLSWIERTLRRIKRFDWKFLGRNYDEPKKNHFQIVDVRKARAASTIPVEGKESSKTTGTVNTVSTTPSSGGPNRTESNTTLFEINNSTESTFEDSWNTTTTVSGALNTVTSSGSINTTDDSRGRNTSSDITCLVYGSGEYVLRGFRTTTPQPYVTRKHQRQYTATESRECCGTANRDNDHSSIGTECPNVDADSLGELADYVHNIFQWVKDLQSRLKEGLNNN